MHADLVAYFTSSLLLGPLLCFGLLICWFSVFICVCCEVCADWFLLLVNLVGVCDRVFALCVLLLCFALYVTFRCLVLFDGLWFNLCNLI